MNERPRSTDGILTLASRLEAALPCATLHEGAAEAIKNLHLREDG